MNICGEPLIIDLLLIVSFDDVMEYFFILSKKNCISFLNLVLRAETLDKDPL